MQLARVRAPASSTPPAPAYWVRCSSRAPPTCYNDARSVIPGSSGAGAAGVARLKRKLVAAHAPQVFQPLQHTGQRLSRCPSGTGRTSTPSAREGSPPCRTPPPCAGGGRSPCTASHVAATRTATSGRTCSSALPSAASFSRRCTTAARAPSCAGSARLVGVAHAYNTHLLVHAS